MPRSTGPLSNARTPLLGPSQAFLACGAKACNNQPFLLNPRCSIPCPWDTLACSSSCEQSPSHLNTPCPPPRGTPRPHLGRHTVTILVAPPARGTLAPVHRATIKCLHPTLGTGTSIPGLWDHNMQQSTKFTDPGLIYPNQSNSLTPDCSIP